MSHPGKYCPNCDRYLSPPLLPSDYYTCNTCMSRINIRDLVSKRNVAFGASGPPDEFDVSVIGNTVMYDGAQNTDTVTVQCSYTETDYLFVIVTTVGANTYPTVTANGTAVPVVIGGGQGTHHRMYLYEVTTHGKGTSVSATWSGQHPNAAIVTVLRGRKISNPSITMTHAYSTQTNLSPTDVMLSSISPQGGNAYAIYTVGVEGGTGTIANGPPGYSLVSLKSTGVNQQPSDIEQAVYVRNLPVPTNLVADTPFSGSVYYGHGIYVVNRT